LSKNPYLRRKIKNPIRSDDEENYLQAIQAYFSEGLQDFFLAIKLQCMPRRTILKVRDIDLIITDQRMPRKKRGEFP